MNNRNLAHNWANQVKPSGKGSNFYYDGPRLYSYGPHFTVGLLVETKRGRIALLNSRRYSVSTTKHQSYAATAASHLTAFRVPCMGADADSIAGNLAYYLERIEAGKKELLTARKYHAMRLEGLGALIREAALFAGLFHGGAATARRKLRGLASALADGGLFSDKEQARINAKITAAREAEEKLQARLEVEQAAKLVEDTAALEVWANGGEDRPPYYTAAPTRLRIKGAAVETSRGAVVSCRAARILWAAIKAGREVVGMVVDGYTVTALNGTLKIGCHVIERAEVERVGALLDKRAEDKEEGADNV